jgi:hypothetical protein
VIRDPAEGEGVDVVVADTTFVAECTDDTPPPLLLLFLAADFSQRLLPLDMLVLCSVEMKETKE